MFLYPQVETASSKMIINLQAQGSSIMNAAIINQRRCELNNSMAWTSESLGWATLAVLFKTHENQY